MTLAAAGNRSFQSEAPLFRRGSPAGASLLLSWPGDTTSLIFEMKRLADCETDAELASLLGKEPSAVAQWRKRKAVPEQALLRFTSLLGRRGER